jgi:hypothetical protein
MVKLDPFLGAGRISREANDGKTLSPHKKKTIPRMDRLSDYTG